MAESPAPLGRFVWHELATTDVDAAIDFYEKVIGWGTRPYHPGYRLWTAGDATIGGLMALPDEARMKRIPPHWMMYVAVPDADTATDQAVRLGAKILKAPHEPGWIDMPDVPPFSVLADPQGAAFGLHQSTHGGDSDEAPEGHFSWHELATDDWRTAWEFYSRLLGWQHHSSFDMGPMGTYFMFKRGGGTRTLGGMFNKPPEMPFPPNWLCYVRVADADRAADAAVERGGKLLNGPMEVPGGDRIAQLMDPQGVAFAVHAVRQEAERPRKAAAKGAAAAAGKKAAKPAKKAVAAKRAPAKPVKRKAARKVARKAVRKAAASKAKPSGRKAVGAKRKAAGRKAAGAKAKRAPKKGTKKKARRTKKRK